MEFWEFFGFAFFQKRHGFKGFDIEKNVRAAEMIFFRNWHYFFALLFEKTMCDSARFLLSITSTTNPRRACSK